MATMSAAESMSSAAWRPAAWAAAQRLRAWQTRQGWAGPDEYHPSEARRHAMTVATFGRAYAILAEAAPSAALAREFEASLADACATLASDRANAGGFRHACWGLPFAWHDNPPHFPYLITTTLAGLCLLGGARRLHDERWLALAHDTGQWLLTEAGGDAPSANEYCLHYAPCPALRVQIHNVNAMAAGFLAQLSQATGEEVYGALAERAVRFTIARQRPDGSWPYGEGPMNKGPESHTGYILEGLALACLARPALNDWVQPALRAGLKFYVTQQYDGPRALHTCRAHSLQEGRLWAHGWGLAALALGATVTGEAAWRQQALSAWEWCATHLARPDGSWRARSTEDAAYPRQIGHLAYGLAYLLQAGDPP